MIFHDRAFQILLGEHFMASIPGFNRYPYITQPKVSQVLVTLNFSMGFNIVARFVVCATYE